MSDNDHRERLKKAYSDTNVSDTYIQQRFDSAPGQILHEAQIRFISHAIKKYQVGNVLEIAPGPARLTIDIGRECPHLTGTLVDVNTNMLLQAQKRLKAAGHGNKWRIVTGDAFALPFEDIFQMVYTFRFIRHFRSEERTRIYRQISDHLKPDGYLIFDAINHDVSAPLRAKAGPESYPIYDKLYRFPQLKEELEQNGFRLIDYVSVQSGFTIQNLIQVLIGPHSPKLAYFLAKTIESVKIWQPLEWIVLCQKV